MRTLLAILAVVLLALPASAQAPVRRVPTVERLLQVNPYAVGTGDVVVYMVDAPTAVTTWGAPRYAYWIPTTPFLSNGTNVIASPFGGEWVFPDRSAPIQDARWWGGTTNVWSIDASGNLVIGGTNVIGQLAALQTSIGAIDTGSKFSANGSLLPSVNLRDTSVFTWKTRSATNIDLELGAGSITSGAIDSDLMASWVDRTNHTGTQAWSTISDADTNVWIKIAGSMQVGSGLTLATNDAANTLTYSLGTHTHNASNITAGTIAPGLLGSSLATNAFLRGDSVWTLLSASDIRSGTFAPTFLGSGSPTTNTFLRGDGSWATLTTNGTSSSSGSNAVWVIGSYVTNLANGTNITWTIAGQTASPSVPASAVFTSPVLWSPTMTGATISTSTVWYSTLEVPTINTPTVTGAANLGGAVYAPGLGVAPSAGSGLQYVVRKTNTMELVPIPPSTVLSDIGAAAAGHNHTALTNLTVTGPLLVGSTNVVAALATLVDSNRVAPAYQSYLLNRTNATGTQGWATISDAGTNVWQAIRGDVKAGTYLSATTNEGANTLTLDVRTNLVGTLANAQTWAAVNVFATNVSVLGTLSAAGNVSASSGTVTAGGITTKASAAGTADPAALWIPVWTNSPTSVAYPVGSLAFLAPWGGTNVLAEVNRRSLTGHVHSASDITSGTMAPSLLGIGTPSTNTFLRGDGQWATISTNGSSGSTGSNTVFVTGSYVTNLSNGANVSWAVSGQQASPYIPSGVTLTNMTAAGSFTLGTTNLAATLASNATTLATMPRVAINGAVIQYPNFQTSSSIGFYVLGTNVTAAVSGSSIPISALTPDATAYLLNRANHTGTLTIPSGTSLTNVSLYGRVSAYGNNTDIAISPDAIASEGSRSINIGFTLGNSAQDAVEIGNTAAASALQAVAVGSYATASGIWSTAIGGQSTASADQSSAIGNHASASGTASVALGALATASHNNSVAIGQNSTTSGANQIVMGTSSHSVIVPGSITLGGTTRSTWPSAAVHPIAAKSGTFTAGESDEVFVCTFGSAGDAVLPLGGAVSDGHSFTVIKSAGSNVTCKDSSGATLSNGVMTTAPASRTYIYSSAANSYFITAHE